MLIESMIRLGRPFINGDLSSAEVIEQVSDIRQEKAKNFFTNVIVVEIEKTDEGWNVAVLPIQEYGEYEKQGDKRVFVPAINRAVGIPFVLPQGGNPTVPQGRYGSPVYLVYDKNIRSVLEEPSKIKEKIRGFLSGRIARTTGLNFNKEMVSLIAEKLADAIKKIELPRREKVMGIIVLAFLEDEGPFVLLDEYPTNKHNIAIIGRSVLHPGKVIASRLDKVLSTFWDAKAEEGAEGGSREGERARCFFCGNTGKVVSINSKAWQWFSTTWTAPFSIFLKRDQLVETTAVCVRCYGALTYGANIFSKLSRRIDIWLTKEIFSPVANATGKRLNRSRVNVGEIYGSVFALPLLDGFFENIEDQYDFVQGVGNLFKEKKENGLDLGPITGFEGILPTELAKDEFRLTIIYYSGDPGRKDVHLRCIIEDVIPSNAKKLVRIAKKIGRYGAEIAAGFQKLSFEQTAWLDKRYGSLPYLLTAAYGAPYLWTTLSKVMHRHSLDRGRFVFNCARRMEDLSRKLPDSRYDLMEEVVFYMVFEQFLNLYEKEMELGGEQLVREWNELVNMLEGPPEEICFRDVKEMGFAAGYVTSLFSRQYRVNTKQETKQGIKGKDFIKDRVMTFGSDLTPEAIVNRGLRKFEEYALRLNFRMSQALKVRTALVLDYYLRHENEVKQFKDAFMTAFWTGYHLASANESKKTEMEEKK